MRPKPQHKRLPTLLFLNKRLSPSKFYFNFFFKTENEENISQLESFVMAPKSFGLVRAEKLPEVSISNDWKRRINDLLFLFLDFIR